MSRTNYVPERGRVYLRRFDHEEATRRREAGERVGDLAAEYGVSEAMIYLATSPGSKRMNIEYAKRWRAGTCEECGGPAMRLIGGKAQHNPDGRCLCVTCRGKASRTRFVEVDGEVQARCSTCHEVKPLGEFPGSTKFHDVRDKGVHNTCRPCHTEIKRRYRQAHPEYRRTNGSGGTK